MDIQTRSPMQIQRNIPFPNTPAPPSLGFGFGFSSQGIHALTVPSLPQKHSIPATISRQSSSNKRRHEPDPDQEDENMSARSPSPDRPKKALSKRIRVEATKATTTPNNKPAAEPHDSVDVGVLLASLPPASLLPILTTLITKHPGLKSLVIPLIPRPTLDSALQALATSFRKIKDAYPYAQPNPMSTGFGFGGASVSRPSTSFGAASSTKNSGMRDVYVQGRLRPVVAEFASTARSYLVYFTSIQADAPSVPQSSGSLPTQSLPAELSHPSETFAYLHALSIHIYRLPPLARNLLYTESSALLELIMKEWSAWLDRIDQHVNRSGGMYGSETVRVWERGLEEMVQCEDKDIKEGVAPPTEGNSASHGAMRPIRGLRDAWVSRVGWLIGRNRTPESFGMDEDEEL